MRFSSLAPFVVCATLIPQSYAWGVVGTCRFAFQHTSLTRIASWTPSGHEIVATIAQMHLHPSVMPKLCDILDVPVKKCHLAPVAAWADNVRRQAKYRWTGPLHYIGAVGDYPSATCAFPGSQGWEGRTHINVLNAIRNTTSVLQEFEELRRAGVQPETVPPYVQDALKFLIHFVGDMHQPLHLTGRNRGGNDDKVAFEGRTTSTYLRTFHFCLYIHSFAFSNPDLHSVWDSKLISERLRTLPWNYSEPLPLPEVEAYLRDTIYDPYIRRLVWEGLLDKWEDELDEWLVCPPSTSSVQHRLQPASTWQTILSLFSSGKNVGEGEGKDGLGVDDDKLCPYAWAQLIHQLNCEIVFPKALDEVSPPIPSSRVFHPGSGHEDEHSCCGDEDTFGDQDPSDASGSSALTRKKGHYLELYTADYAGRIKQEWIVEKLLTQAGVRLAAVLNWIFVELDEGDVKRILVAHS